MPTMQPMTMADLLALPPAFNLDQAGLAWGYGHTKSHQLAKAGEFPCQVLRKGKRYVVTKAALFEALGIPAQFLFATDPAEVKATLAAAAAAADESAAASQSAA